MPGGGTGAHGALHRGTDDEGNQEAGEAGSGHDVTELGSSGSVLDDLSETAAETGDDQGIRATSRASLTQPLNIIWNRLFSFLPLVRL